MTVPMENLRKMAGSMGILLNDAQCRQFEHFAALLARWNTVYNLTRIEPGHDTVTAHLLDSLSANAWVKGPRVLDVGTGAGFPGVPLAIVRPEFHFHLMDSHRKKTRFVLQVQIELNLVNVEVVTARIESWQPADQFDTVITRAVSQIGETIRQAQPILRPDGRFVFMKGQVPTQELRAIPAGFHVADVVAVSVPGLAAARHLVIVCRDDSEKTQ